MKNFLQSGETVTVTAPEAADSGEFLVVGGLYGVAVAAAENGAPVVLNRCGVYLLPKATGAVWAQGDELFWDVSAKKFTKDATKLSVQAVAFAAALTGDTTGAVLLGAPGGLKMAAGQATTVAASDTIVTGLSALVAALATLDSDLVDDPEWVSASIGDQAGTPAAGSFLLKTWKNTSGSDPTPTAATTFSKKVNWVAFGY
ncbi:DUF2190 family protein [Reyranella sp.]|uniref:DUF2190 family protein n=1 Tax=Reyranella sp. TaxID=1929291 RepID=UPI003D1354E4